MCISAVCQSTFTVRWSVNEHVPRYVPLVLKSCTHLRSGQGPGFIVQSIFSALECKLVPLFLYWRALLAL